MLKTNYLDDIPAAGETAPRKYEMTDNGDGSISLNDVTDYAQMGDSFGAADINATNKAVNSLKELASGTLLAGNKSVTISSSLIYEGGHIDVYVPLQYIKTMIPESISVSNGSCTVVFGNSLSVAIPVEVRCA